MGSNRRLAAICAAAACTVGLALIPAASRSRRKSVARFIAAIETSASAIASECRFFSHCRLFDAATGAHSQSFAVWLGKSLCVTLSPAAAPPTSGPLGGSKRIWWPPTAPRRR